MGYLSGKATSKILGVYTCIPALFLVSIIPDMDIVIPDVQHRGLTHSMIFLVIFLPVFLFYGKRAAPYFVALIQHSLVGDYITNGCVQLLWPFSHQAYGLGIALTSPTNILMEWILFLTSLALMVGTNDLRILFETHLSNFLLVIPFIAVLAPAMLNLPVHVPVGLLLPHLVYSALFTLSILFAFKVIWRNKRKTMNVHREVTVDRISSPQEKNVLLLELDNQTSYKSILSKSRLFRCDGIISAKGLNTWLIASHILCNPQ